MIDIFKIIGVGFITLIITIILKEYNKEYVVYVLSICGIIIVVYSMDAIREIIAFIKNISNNDLIELLLKITGISILTEYVMSICKDLGENSIATKIDFGSKVIILSLAIPIVSNTFEVLIKLLA